MVIMFIMIFIKVMTFIIHHQRSLIMTHHLLQPGKLLAHVWVADASQRHKSLLHSLNIKFENRLVLTVFFANLQLWSLSWNANDNWQLMKKNKSQLSGHLRAGPLEHVVRTSSLVVGAGQAERAWFWFILYVWCGSLISSYFGFYIYIS